jgi:pullulanase/glycogen debranching enzyme
MEVISTNSGATANPTPTHTPIPSADIIRVPRPTPDAPSTPEINKGQPPSFNSSPAVRLEPAGCVPDETNWREVSSESSLKMSHSFTSVVEQLYQDDVRKQGPLFEPSVSSAVYFLVHTAPHQTTPLEVLIYDSPDDTNPSVIPMTRLEDGRQFVGIDDGGKTIGEGTRFAYRNPQTGALIADPYAYQLSQFEWTTVPRLDEMPNQSHFKPIQCTVRQDPLVAAARKLGRDITASPDYNDIRTFKFHPSMTDDLSDEQLGEGFEGTQGTLKALQSPFVQEKILKGCNQIELFPIHSFGTEVPTFYAGGRKNDDAKNVWGYMPISHFSIDPSRVFNKSDPWFELLQTVDSLHMAGFKVVVDEVPHSFEAGDELSTKRDSTKEPENTSAFMGPDLSFRILDRAGYYPTYKDGRLRDYSACGNAFRFTPVPGRKYEQGSLESNFGEGGAYFIRSMRTLFRAGIGVRVDQGPILGRDGDNFSPDSKVYVFLSKLANRYGTTITYEPCDAGPAWYQVKPYAPHAQVHHTAKPRTQDFETLNQILLAASEGSAELCRKVACIWNGNDAIYGREGQLTESNRVIIFPHDGKSLFDRVVDRQEHSSFFAHHKPYALKTLLSEDEKKTLPADEASKQIQIGLAAAGTLCAEFLTTFAPTTNRTWVHGTQWAMSRDGEPNSYNKPQYWNKSFINDQDRWRVKYHDTWLQKEELRVELGIFAHDRIVPDSQLKATYFDYRGEPMSTGNADSDHVRWQYGRVLSKWYSGREMNKPDVLVTWCAGPRNDAENPVRLPEPGVNESGEKYVWLRRADSSSFPLPSPDGDGMRGKDAVFEPLIVEEQRGILFNTVGVQVFQRLLEREARELVQSYWEKKGQA